MSLTFKILSLVVRTAAKPIGNSIKAQAKEHEGFRRFAINAAQRLHRFDMRMRLGLLHDSAAQERMHEQAKKAEEAKKKAAAAAVVPTVRTEAEQKKFEAEQTKEKEEGKKKEEKAPKYHIRPLSEAKAIELGANFASESFVFMVAISLLLFENWRSRRKQSNRRDDVDEKLDQLEQELEMLRSKYEPDLQELHEKGEAERERQRLAQNSKSWYNPAGWWSRTDSERTVQDGIEKTQSPLPETPSSGPEVTERRNSAGINTPPPAPHASPKEKGAQILASAQQTADSKEGDGDSVPNKDLSTRLDSILASKKER